MESVLGSGDDLARLIWHIVMHWLISRYFSNPTIMSMNDMIQCSNDSIVYNMVQYNDSIPWA